MLSENRQDKGRLIIINNVNKECWKKYSLLALYDKVERFKKVAVIACQHSKTIFHKTIKRA